MLTVLNLSQNLKNVFILSEKTERCEELTDFANQSETFLMKMSADLGIAYAANDEAIRR